jgi:hypothetical protein
VLWCCERLGGKEGPTSLDAGTEPQGLRLAEVEEAVALSPPGLVQQLPGATTTAESTPSTLGLITLGMKRAGKRSAGKPHAAFDVAGAGNVAMVELCTQPAIERVGLETRHLQQARLPSTLPNGGIGRKGSNDLARGLPYLLRRSRFRQRLSAGVRRISKSPEGRYELGGRLRCSLQERIRFL